MRLIGYVRVSTDKQAETGLGLQVQERAIKAWAKQAGHKIVRWERDEGESGSNGLDTRLGLAAAFAELERSDSIADGLAVYRLDRLSRKLRNQIIWTEMLEERGKCIISVTEPDVGEDEMRTLVRQILGSISEYERAVINRRMRSGRVLKAEQGGFAFGSPAFGQRSVKGQLVTDEDETATVARMKKLRAEGLSYRLIAAQLNTEGLTSKRGGTWHPQTVQRVLDRLNA